MPHSHPVALQLSALRQSGQPSDIPAEAAGLTQADAFLIQQQVVHLLQDRIGAWKCGLPSGDKLIAAPIHARDVHDGPVCPVLPMDGQIKVEPEIAFVMGQDLPPRETPYSETEIMAAVTNVRLALELISYRFKTPAALPFALKLADCLSNQGLLLGPSILAHKANLPGQLMLSIDTATGSREQAAEHPNQNPWLPLFWLTNFLTLDHGGLKAGQVVITGSYAGVVDLPLTGQTRICFGDLGSIVTDWHCQS